MAEDGRIYPPPLPDFSDIAKYETGVKRLNQSTLASISNDTTSSFPWPKVGDGESNVVDKTLPQVLEEIVVDDPPFNALMPESPKWCTPSLWCPRESEDFERYAPILWSDMSKGVLSF